MNTKTINHLKLRAERLLQMIEIAAPLQLIVNETRLIREKGLEIDVDDGSEGLALEKFDDTYTT